MSRRAILLAGGKGTRLKPLTICLPKPLVPVGDYPILEIIVRQLAHFGFSHLTMAVNHHAELIRAFFGDGSRWGVTIDYAFEEEPLGTMGPLKRIENLPDHFLVMNGDVLTDLDFAAFLDAHVQADRLFTVAAYQREECSEYGVLQLDADGRIIGFQEKPVVSYDVSMGIYGVSRRILSRIPQDGPFGFDHLMLRLIADETYSSVQRFDGYWMDIGRPDDYARVVQEFDDMRERLLK